MSDDHGPLRELGRLSDTPGLPAQPALGSQALRVGPLAQSLADLTPPHGIARPGPLALIEHDEYTHISATLRAEIRTAFAAAVDRVRRWQPASPLPGRGRLP